MNYIELINHFWALNKEYSFTPNEKAIYFALLNKCNELGWKNPFNQSNEYLALDSGVAKPSIQRAKNTLKQKGLISFKQGNGRSNNTEYEILNLNKGNQKTGGRDTLSDTLSDTVVINNNKLNKTKQKEREEKSPNGSPTPKKSFKQFTEQEFKNSLTPYWEKSGGKYSAEMLKAFFDYWTEPSANGTMRFQLQETWDTARRLRTWESNEGKFDKKPTAAKPKEPELYGPW